jgi:cell division protein ZipA
MDTLRVILILIGIGIVAIVYFWSRRESGGGVTLPQSLRFRMPKRALQWLQRLRDGHGTETASAESEEHPFKQQLDAETASSFGSFVAERGPLETDQAQDSHVMADVDADLIAPGGEQLVISLCVLAHDGERFAGDAIIQAVEDLGLQFGAMNIYHCLAKAADGHGQAVCSVANLLEPGHLKIDNPQNFATPGLAIFMVLPGPQEPREAFETLLEVGRGLASALDGELCDESRSVITNQTIGHLKEKIESYRFKQRMARLQQRGGK